MKFSAIIAILLIAIIAITQASPVTKRGVGPQVKPLGVRFKDLYQQFTNQINKVNKKFDAEIKSFNEQIPKAAAADGTSKEDAEWLVDWNGKYKSIVNKVKGNTKKLNASIKKLGDKLDQ